MIGIMDTPSVAQIEGMLQKARGEFRFSSHQLDAFGLVDSQQQQGKPHLRACLYHRTGAGKSITSLVMVKLSGHNSALVIAPPITHDSWHRQAQELGMGIEVVSHAKFRQREYKLARTRAVICDEFHLLGGNTGMGWRKFDRAAASLQAPVVICSATPNYNDAERVYCVMHALDPMEHKGGFLDFIYKHCRTEQNPYGMTPFVTGFLFYKDAEHMLSSQPYVTYLPDPSQVEPVDVRVPGLLAHIPVDFTLYNLNRRTNRIMASAMEIKHQRKYHAMIQSNGRLRASVYEMLTQLVGDAQGPTLIFSESSTVLDALEMSMIDHGVVFARIDGGTSTNEKIRRKELFTQGAVDVLIGTASLATGMDGIDKMCDTLIILDDTDDNAKRRQLIGRILPRGLDTDESNKRVYRLVW